MHKLSHILSRKDIQEYSEDARCDECDVQIHLDSLYKDAIGFFHCKRCEYDICRKCASRGLAEVSRRKQALVGQKTSVSQQASPLTASSLSSLSKKRLDLKSTLHKISQESESDDQWKLKKFSIFSFRQKRNWLQLSINFSELLSRKYHSQTKWWRKCINGICHRWSWVNRRL